MTRTTSNQGEKTIKDKVKDWLHTEGYPLEYRTANIYRKNGFDTTQGSYVRGHGPGDPREIDVVASMTQDITGNQFARVSNIIECKYSSDRPWIVFTDHATAMSPAACVSQSAASILGESAIWIVAGIKALHEMQLFETPRQGGFGGRQAFAKGNDVFYNSVQSVIDNCHRYVQEYDDQRRAAASVPEACVVALPTIVVEGKLFRSYFDAGSGSLEVEEVGMARLHWKGSALTSGFSTIDIVTIDHLSDYVRKRASEVPVFLDSLTAGARIAAQCAKNRSLEGLTIAPESRGTVGLPQLLSEVQLAQRTAHLRR